MGRMGMRIMCNDKMGNDWDVRRYECVSLYVLLLLLQVYPALPM
jgi:hypothetical protein